MKLEELRAALDAHEAHDECEAPKTPRPDPTETQAPRSAHDDATELRTQDANDEALRAAIMCERCGRKRAFFRDTFARVYVIEPCRVCQRSGNKPPA